MNWLALRLYGGDVQALRAIESNKRMRGGTYKVFRPVTLYHPRRLPGRGPVKPVERSLYQGWAFVAYGRPDDSYILGCCSGVCRVIGTVPSKDVEAVMSAGVLHTGPSVGANKFRKGQKVKLALNRLSEIIGTYEAEEGEPPKIKFSMFGKDDNILDLTEERAAQLEAAE